MNDWSMYGLPRIYAVDDVPIIEGFFEGGGGSETNLFAYSKNVLIGRNSMLVNNNNYTYQSVQLNEGSTFTLSGFFAPRGGSLGTFYGNTEDSQIKAVVTTEYWDSAAGGAVMSGATTYSGTLLGSDETEITIVDSYKDATDINKVVRGKHTFTTPTGTKSIKVTIKSASSEWIRVDGIQLVTGITPKNYIAPSTSETTIGASNVLKFLGSKTLNYLDKSRAACAQNTWYYLQETTGGIDMVLNFTSGGGDLIVDFGSSMWTSGSASNIYLCVELDGVLRQEGELSVNYLVDNPSGPYNSFRIPNVQPGFHTIKLAYHQANVASITVAWRNAVVKVSEVADMTSKAMIPTNFPSKSVQSKHLNIGWIPFTPVWSAGGGAGNFTFGTGAINQGYYQVIGDTVNVRFNCNLGSTPDFGTRTNFRMDFPVFPDLNAVPTTDIGLTIGSFTYNRRLVYNRFGIIILNNTGAIPRADVNFIIAHATYGLVLNSWDYGTISGAAAGDKFMGQFSYHAQT
jgi:hypothetical protein